MSVAGVAEVPELGAVKFQRPAADCAEANKQIRPFGYLLAGTTKRDKLR